MRRAQVALTGVLFLVLAATGCLEFDKQTVYFERDQAADRLIMVINYGGFYAEKVNGKQDLPEAQQQLDDAVKDHTAAFFGNFPWLWSSAMYRERMGNPKENQDTPQGVRDKLTRLTELVTVLNGGFYSDPAGGICGAQVVVVEHVTEAIDLINGAINESLLSDAGKGQEKPGEFEKLAAEAARKGHKWVELDGDSLIVRVPMTEGLLEEGWAKGIDNLLTDEADVPVPLATRLRQFLSAPMFVWYQDGVLSFKLGLPSRPFTLNSRPRQGNYQPNMVDYITKKYGLDLDARIARYLLTPDAPATEEADQAAKLMAPRLATEERARVLVEQLRSAPSDALWDLLRQTPTPPGVMLRPEMASKADLLKNWQRWLEEQAAGPDTEKAKAGDTDNGG
jgi:hypothetical protein